VNAKNNNQKSTSELKHSLILFILLFVFWLVLSGHFELKYILIGLVTCMAAIIVTRPLMHLKTGEDREYMAYDLPYLKLIAYIPWLLWQIVLANIDVALRVLNPALPIEPQIITFKKEMHSPVAYLTLANSITLTPGTITIDVQDGTFTVHALSKKAAEGLVPEEGEGEMPLKVAKIFEEEY